MNIENKNKDKDTADTFSSKKFDPLGSYTGTFDLETFEESALSEQEVGRQIPHQDADDL